jgi:hypothetical protein
VDVIVNVIRDRKTTPYGEVHVRAFAAMAATVDGYLAALPEDRRAALSAIRDVINQNLPAGYEEGIQYRAISWFVPLSRYPDTYNKQPLCLATLASQKNHMALYLMTVYGNKSIETWFRKAYADAGKKLDMGKSCVRFTSLDGVPLNVIGELIGKVPVDSYIEYTRKALGAYKAKKKKAAKKVAAKKATAKKATAKKAASKKRAPSKSTR